MTDFQPSRVPQPAATPWLSPQTKEELKYIEWQEGDPVPPELGEQLTRMRAEMAREASIPLKDTELAKNWQPPRATTINIKDLPEEKRAELTDWLKTYKTSQGTTSYAVDDRALPPASPESTPAPASPVTAAPPSPNWQASPPPPPAPEIPPAAVTEPAALQHTHCQRCQWPQDQPFDIECTAADKTTYLIAVLGPSQFQKEYSLYNGYLTIRYSSLTTAEETLVSQQMAAHLRAGEIAGTGACLAAEFEYRMALSVTQISVGGRVVYVRPDQKTVQETIKLTEIPATWLVALKEYFYTAAATQQHGRRTFLLQFQQFQRLLELLETQAANKDFWKGIELPT